MIYLDNAATSFLKPASVKGAVLRAMASCSSPGRGGYASAAAAAKQVYRCRELAGKLFDCDGENVVFTMNATHGLNMAIRTLLPPGGNAVISGFEHNAVTRPLHALGAKVEVAGRKLFSPEDTLEQFHRAVTEETHCVICTHVSNVFGYILPVEEIAKLCRSRGVPFILDASQSAGTLPVSMKNIPADFIAMPGHKGLCGPPGTGLLLCGTMPKPLICGGTGSLSKSAAMPDFLPDGAEAGTQNVWGIAGLAQGLHFVAETGTETIFHHERRFCRRLYEKLRKNPYLTLFWGDDKTQTGVLSLCVKGKDCESAAEYLSRHDCAVRAGLHCAPLAHESAGTLESGTVRLSPSYFTPVSQVETAAELIHRFCVQKNGK